jgi:hypothetical protein
MKASSVTTSAWLQKRSFQVDRLATAAFAARPGVVRW